MWTKPPPDVSCVSNSVESFYRGTVAGGIFGLVFGPETGVGLLAHLKGTVRPAALAGVWCLLTSFSSCVLTRDGFPYPYNGAISGLFSGAVLSIVNRWDRDSTLWTMAGSSVLSILSHYATDGQSMNVKATSCAPSVYLVLAPSMQGRGRRALFLEVRGKPAVTRHK
ncbi:unnamed protein product [Symbiodinium sp. CCMP2592]|nr:unnamed protein product [Symbiodinium sp. CCMP2592]